MEETKRRALKRLAEQLLESKAEANQTLKFLRDNPDKSQQFIKKIESWSCLYSLQFEQVLVLYFDLLGSRELLLEVADNLHHDYSIIDKIADLKFDDVGDNEQLLIHVLFSLHYSIEALAQRNRTLNDMVAEIRSEIPNFEEVIFEAVSVDPSAISNREIAKYISRWHLLGKTDYINKLARALKGTYPKPRSAHVDPLRVIMQAMEEMGEKITPESLMELNDCIGLMVEGEDFQSAISKHIQTRRKDTRRSKLDQTS